MHPAIDVRTGIDVGKIVDHHIMADRASDVDVNVPPDADIDRHDRTETQDRPFPDFNRGGLQRAGTIDGREREAVLFALRRELFAYRRIADGADDLRVPMRRLQRIECEYGGAVYRLSGAVGIVIYKPDKAMIGVDLNKSSNFPPMPSGSVYGNLFQWLALLMGWGGTPHAPSIVVISSIPLTHKPAA